MENKHPSQRGWFAYELYQAMKKDKDIWLELMGDFGYNTIMPFTKGHPFYKGGEKGWFKKGQTPWSKSQKGVTLNTGRTHFKKGQSANPTTEFKKKDPRITGKNNSNWKGDEVGYFALHAWVTRHLGKAWKCLKCDGTRSNKYEWANVSHEYKRDITDWTMLCSICHHEYDKTGRKIWESRRRNGTVTYKKTTD